MTASICSGRFLRIGSAKNMATPMAEKQQQALIADWAIWADDLKPGSPTFLPVATNTALSTIPAKALSGSGAIKKTRMAKLTGDNRFPLDSLSVYRKSHSRFL